MPRSDGRTDNQLRPIKFTRKFTMHAPGSVLCEFGNTRVLCSAMVEDSVPPHIKAANYQKKPEDREGWLSAEYGMLPSSTNTRKQRDKGGKVDGRSVEIQRLIGRSLRTIVDLVALGERQITIDCDVIQADGGTRTASITGAWVALHDCIRWMRSRDMVKDGVIRDHVAAVSCGVFNGKAVLDLDYTEDSEAETDANFVMTGAGNIIEIQATAEKVAFSEEQLLALLGLARRGVGKLVDLQKMAVA